MYGAKNLQKKLLKKCILGKPEILKIILVCLDSIGLSIIGSMVNKCIIKKSGFSFLTNFINGTIFKRKTITNVSLLNKKPSFGIILKKLCF